MAIMALFTGTMTLSEYDTLRFAVGWARTRPPGAIFHVSSFDESGGACIAEIWESSEALAAFLAERLTPAQRALRIEPLAMVTYPVGGVLAYPAIERYRI